MLALRSGASETSYEPQTLLVPLLWRLRVTVLPMHTQAMQLCRALLAPVDLSRVAGLLSPLKMQGFVRFWAAGRSRRYVRLF